MTEKQNPEKEAEEITEEAEKIYKVWRKYRLELQTDVKERLEQVLKWYNKIQRENPNFFYLHHLLDKKLECIRKLREYESYETRQNK